MIFLVQAVIRYSYRLRHDIKEHLRALSFFPVWESLSSPGDMMIVRERWVQLIAGTLPAIGLGLALAALQVLPAKDKPDEAPATIIINISQK